MTQPTFASLPVEFQNILQQVKEEQEIEIVPLEELKGGRTGARLFLVSIAPISTGKVAHLILKLDHVPKLAKLDEIQKHSLALSEAPADFAKRHMAEIAFDRAQDGCVAIFYDIAGHSLINFRPRGSSKE